MRAPRGGAPLEPALLLALLGVVQPPLHMLLAVLLRAAGGERSEALVFGFLTGTILWAALGAVSLAVRRRSPSASPGRRVAGILSWAGLILLACLLVFALNTVFYGLL
ncbi:hypothetical protein [uncultured Pseudoflavonifractor sp.]|uniref:hypothetical protein n=1 Tax=uncultured Pseudoflavonifractor sp. TaxID=1221379 RepID=UPI0025E900A8|nr:hypothetical protein [uncultured Pseudoflavonifractor sp.]